MAHMPYALRQRVLNDLRPIMEKWSGEELEATSCYGVRSYKRGSILAVHVDRVSTHVISGIINVQQEVDEDWLLYAKDHNRTIHQITMVPGDLVSTSFSERNVRLRAAHGQILGVSHPLAKDTS
ncbi:unnamed protein product [Phaeothamnion confervicola]